MSERIKTGCLFGSFNPIHNGHLMIAQYMATQTDLDEVQLVVSPQNPLKTSDSLAADYHRLEMVMLAVNDNHLLSVNNIEFELKKPSFTIQTLEAFTEKHPMRDYKLIIGSDNLAIFKKWKDWEKILDKYGCYVYLRPEYEPGDLTEHPNVKIFKPPLIRVSSTYIRKNLAAGISNKYLIPGVVESYISEQQLYQIS